MLTVAGQITADTVVFEDFEDSTLTYTQSKPDNLTDLTDMVDPDWYGRLGPTTGLPSAGYSYNTIAGQGSHFFGVEDHNFDGSSNLMVLDWTAINVSAFTNLNLSWLVAEDDAEDGGEDWDGLDSFRIEVQSDGGGYTTVFQIESTGVVGNSAPSVDADFNGQGDGVVFITDTFASFNTNLADAGVLDIRVVFDGLTVNDEDLAFDSLHLQGTAVVPEPTSLGLVLLLGTALGFRRKRN